MFVWGIINCVGECVFVVNILNIRNKKVLSGTVAGFFLFIQILGKESWIAKSHSGSSIKLRMTQKTKEMDMSEKAKLAQGQVVFLRGCKTILRPPNLEKDQELFYKWINDPEVRRFLKVIRPMSLKAEGEWIDATNSTSTCISFTIETLDGQPIGTMSLDRINWKDRRAVTGTFIGEAEFRDKGYGTDAKMALLKYAFEELNLHKVCSGALGFNDRSVAYSKKCGYKVEGREKQQIFRDGKYYDHILLGVFRKDWERAYKTYLAKIVI